MFTLTWVFSGLLSMEPFAWTNARGVSVDEGLYNEGELDPGAFPSLATLEWNGLVPGDVKQIDFEWLQGEPYLLASYSVPRDASSGKRDRLHQPYNIYGQSEAQSVLIAARTGELVTGFDSQALVVKLDAAVADASVTDVALLDAYDDYYYSRQNQLPLPVLRVKFDDPAASWIYVDPQRSQLLTLVHRAGRLERWLYNGLHSLDFAFWYHRRPLWDIGVLTLLLGGLGISAIGLWFGLRRLKQDVLLLVRRGKTHRALKEISHASS
jgi:hypothetical protein